MKAAVLREFGEALAIEAVERPRPGPDEALLRVRACGVDGTDLKLLDGFGYAPKLPFIMGHEIAGEVVEIGAGVREFSVGDRVAVYNFVSCGYCVYCRTFHEQLCRNMRGVVGVLGLPGGYAEYVCVPARQLIHLPDGVTWADGATCCDAGMTALRAAERADVRVGERALVIGVGGVGSLLTQILAASGVEVVAVDRDAGKEAWAVEQGASVFIAAEGAWDGDGRPLVGALADVDCVVDVVGLRETMRAGFAAMRPGGRMVIVGYTPEVFPLSGKVLAQEEKAVIGSRAGRRDDLRRCLGLFARGELRSIVRGSYALERVNEAHAHLRAGLIGRIVIEQD